MNYLKDYAIAGQLSPYSGGDSFTLTLIIDVDRLTADRVCLLSSPSATRGRCPLARILAALAPAEQVVSDCAGSDLNVMG